jgi:hypothetical protein
MCIIGQNYAEVSKKLKAGWVEDSRQGWSRCMAPGEKFYNVLTGLEEAVCREMA